MNNSRKRKNHYFKIQWAWWRFYKKHKVLDMSFSDYRRHVENLLYLFHKK